MVKTLTFTLFFALVLTNCFSQNKEIDSLIQLASKFETKGDLPRALELNFQGLVIAEKNNWVFDKSRCLSSIGDVFWDLDDYSRSISSYQQSLIATKKIKEQPEIKSWRIGVEQNLGAVFMLNNQYDSAFAHLQKLVTETSDNDYIRPTLLMFFGDLQFRMGKRNEGLDYLRQSFEKFQKRNDPYSLGDVCRFISECFRQMNMVDSSIFYAKKGLDEARSIDYRSPMLYNSKMLAELYESKDISKALYYRKVYDTVNDIYYGPDKVKGLQKALSDEQERQKALQDESIQYKNRLIQYSLLSGLGIILLIAYILYRHNQQKKTANILLQNQKEKVENTLTELKSAQAQLVQSEKMASLGELTAGIAHEIQNPLNFVNNFSDVNTELIDELQEEAEKGNLDEVKTIANDIKENEEKINHHGKRAGDIVKSMLQHSRVSTGKKELTDINALADEYLRLSYHGLRAKDKTFNATMKTDFDNSIEKINIIPQDIGRVLLNLFNNAFYACTERSRSTVNQQISKNPISYEPTVSVSTKKSENHVLITVSDNGNGIPEKVKGKIFQPFFTTKPTGQGTGLGLSLSYDIIKAHGGTIKVETKEGEGVEFIVTLPLTANF